MIEKSQSNPLFANVGRTVFSFFGKLWVYKVMKCKLFPIKITQ